MNEDDNDFVLRCAAIAESGSCKLLPREMARLHRLAGERAEARVWDTASRSQILYDVGRDVVRRLVGAAFGGGPAA